MNKIGYWVPEKKRKKLNFEALGALLKERDIELVLLDLHRPLTDQGPFSVILHKLTDVVTQATQGDNKAKCMMENLQNYIDFRPQVVVIDPLDSVKNVMNRNISYQLLQDCIQSNNDIQKLVRVPNFVEIHTTKEAEIRQKLQEAQVGFPFVCKHSQGHGSAMSHKMALIFNEAGLKDVKPPCVAQTFINHDAILHKLFVVGDQYFVVQRPSLKNFPTGSSEQNTIFFDSHDVSKQNSTSFLNELDESDADRVMLEPCSDVLGTLAGCLHKGLQMALFGVDVIVENHTGIHYIIDVNSFPGYDGVPDFMGTLFKHIEKILGSNHATTQTNSLDSRDTKVINDSTLLPNGISTTVKECNNHEVRHLCSETNKAMKRPHGAVIENGVDSVELSCKKSPIAVNGDGPELK